MKPLFHKQTNLIDAHWNEETDLPVVARVHVSFRSSVVITFGIQSSEFQIQIPLQGVAQLRDLLDEAIQATEAAEATA